MVIKEKYEGKESYKSEECGFHYTKKRDAKNCEEHCRDYNSCDTLIVEDSMERSG